MSTNLKVLQVGHIHINVAIQLLSQGIFEIELLIDSSQINLSLILDGLTKEEEKMYRWQKYSQKIKSNQPWQIWREKFFVTKSSTDISGSCRRLCSSRLTQRWASDRLWLMTDIRYILYSYIVIYYIDIYYVSWLMTDIRSNWLLKTTCR